VNARRRFLATTALAVAGLEAGLRRGAHAQGEEQMPPLDGATGWLNSPPLTPAGLRGKVVVVDFWTYTCINWLRSLPYVRAWAERYGRYGLVVIGVHSPEFTFEQDTDNVRWAVKSMRIHYPVAVDSDHGVWRAFDNHYWPALYFVDARGRIRHRHFGEGRYEESESVIRRLLSEAGVSGLPGDAVAVDARGLEVAADWDRLKSPENYLGHERTAKFASPGGVTPGKRRTYAAPARLKLNHWALSGDWTFEQDAAVLETPGGRIACSFHARDLHLVMAPAARGQSVRFRVLLDGKAPGPARGDDVDEQGRGTVVEPRLYQLIRQSTSVAARRFDIEFLDAAAKAYAFTFG
jgi:thiol-disulfide isomerase/thioredoxin